MVQLIKAFAAEASEKALETVRSLTLDSQYHALIEDDNPVKAINSA